MRHCYIDTETTGLDPTTHEVIEVAIITEHEDGTVDSWVSKIAPQRIETAHPKALEINGYTPEAWKDAPTRAEVAPTISKLLKGSVVVGHNVAFDIGFIAALFEELGIEHRWSYRDQLDTIVYVREHLFPTGLKSASLDNARRWLGWSTEGAHAALKDAEDCRRLKVTLERSTSLDRLVWSLAGPRRMRRARR